MFSERVFLHHGINGLLKMDKSILNLNSFLKFGYFLDYRNKKYEINLKCINRSKLSGLEEHDLIELLGNYFKKAIIKQYKPNVKNCVPLSGGLDSRAILAVLLELTDAKSINTYTFGTPGTYDYELGKEIAKKTGTNHIQIKLNDFDYSEEDLISTAKRFDYQTILFFHPPLKYLDDLFGDNAIWSGAIIDVFLGRHFHKSKSVNLESAILNSFKENLFVKSCDLACASDLELFSLIDYNESVDGLFCYEHIIDLLNRQLKYIAPHVLYNGSNFKVLFTDTDLIDFILSIDQNYNTKQYLYKKMLWKNYKDIFKVGYKDNFGLSLFANTTIKQFLNNINRFKKMINKIRPVFQDNFINYFDFSQRLNSDDRFSKIVYDNVMDLSLRKLIYWVDIITLLDNHRRKIVDHSDALLVLASLELNLKAGKTI